MANWRPQNYHAEEIVQNIKSKKFVVPQYQRGQVWKTSQEAAFIDSIKKGYPFGTLLLFEDDNNTYHIIDGLQRCTTIYKYLSNPAAFFSEKVDLDDDIIEEIYVLLGITGSKESIMNEIKQIIAKWVTETHKSLSDVVTMQYSKCARKITDQFPTGNEHRDNIADLLEPMFRRYVQECQSFNQALIPVIIYQGDRANLPDVFKRINSKGTNLTKYQILAATWADVTMKITHEELEPIIEYVKGFFTTLLKSEFAVADYNEGSLSVSKELTLYQVIFGFGKLLKVRFPHLFGGSEKAKDVESCGFTLINACLGNRNSKLEDLPDFINEFKTDEDKNDFLLKIMEVCKIVDDVIRPYNAFKLNKRNPVSILHSELQVCSIIANAFINKYGTITETAKKRSISLSLNRTNQSWKQFKNDFKNNLFLHYLSDIINQRWSGSGDSTLDEVIYNSTYYTSRKNKHEIENDLDHWFSRHNASRNESENVAQPKDQEKLLLSILYLDKFTANDQLNNSKYDIEHLATKGSLKNLLKQFPGAKLPISSFGNICLLPEYENRRKKEKTIYEDQYYLSHLSGITLLDIEREYTLTQKKDLDWLSTSFSTFDELRDEYSKFITERFKNQKEVILNNLFK